MGAIDIGSPAINRASPYGMGAALMIIVKENPANASGTIDTVKIWAMSNMTGCRVGTFYTANGNTLQCRDSAVIGDVTAGSEQIFTEDSEGAPLAIAVEAGDYIGYYYDTGMSERDDFGDGVWYFEDGELIDPGDEGDYGFLDNRTISLGGTGEEAAPPAAGAAGGMAAKLIAAGLI